MFQSKERIKQSEMVKKINMKKAHGERMKGYWQSMIEQKREEKLTCFVTVLTK